MASNGIRDRVAIVGMGCTSFGERWDKSVSDLLVDATKDATASAGIDLKDIDAFWLGTLFSGQSGLTLSRPLKIDYKPVSRLENYCATGSEAFRNACYAVASGAYDIAMAIGVEKLKDSGFSGLPSTRSVGDGTAAGMTAPAMFSLLAPAYAKKYGVSDEQLKEVMTRIAWKNHKNGALNPRAQFRKEVPKETIACSPLGAGGGADRSRLRLHDVQRGRGLRRRRLRAGRHQGPAPGAGDGRGARLLHADGAGAHGGPRLRGAWHRVEGGPRRQLRPRRRAGRQSRRRAQVVRPPHRRVRSSHAVRVLAAAARRSRQAADRQRRARAHARAHPQPRRRAGRVRLVRERGRLGEELACPVSSSPRSSPR